MDFLKKIGKEIVGDKSHQSSGQVETWHITAVCAEGVKDRDGFTKSDPYLMIDFGDKKVRTKTVKNNLSPQWNETFTFQLDSNKVHDLKIKVRDDDIGFDDTIGWAVVSKADLPMHSGEEKNLQVPISNKDQEMMGVVRLKVRKIVEGQYSQQQQYGQQQQQYTQYPSQQQQYGQFSSQQQYGGQPQQQYSQFSSQYGGQPSSNYQYQQQFQR